MITAVEQERKGQICSCCGGGAGDDAAVTSSVGGRWCCCTGSGRSLFLEEKTGCLSCNGQLGRVWGREDEGRSWRQLLAFGFKGRRRWWNRLRKKKIKREGFGAVFG